MDLARLQPSTFTSRTTELAIPSLWAVVTQPSLLGDLSSELQTIRMLDNEPVALGSRFEGDQLRGDRRWTTTSTVTAFDVHRLFEWTVGELSEPVSRWSFLIDDVADVSTLTHRVVLCGGPSPLSDYLDAHPEQAEETVHERLTNLRIRMGITIDGLLDIARRQGPSPL